MFKKYNVDVVQLTKADFFKPYIKYTNKYAVFPKDNAITMSILQGWQYHDYMFEFFVKNNIDLAGLDIIDIGANNGQFSVDFAHLVGNQGRVHSFEPQRILYYQLCAQVFMNGLDNVFCHNVALGNEEGVVEMEKPDYYSKDHVNFGDVCVKNSSTGIDTESVRLKKLDSYKFNRVAFIKLDVQGYEPFVLEGAVNTIQEHRPYMMIEFEEPTLNKFGKSEEALKEQVESLGYVVKRLREGVVYHSYSGWSIDHICIPKEKFEAQNYIIP